MMTNNSFFKLTITGNQNILVSLLNSIKETVLYGFVVDHARTIDYARHIPSLRNDHALMVYCVKDGLRVAIIAVVIDQNDLRIANISGQVSGQLTFKEYNDILLAFSDDVIKENDVFNQNKSNLTLTIK